MLRPWKSLKTGQVAVTVRWLRQTVDAFEQEKETFYSVVVGAAENNPNFLSLSPARGLPDSRHGGRELLIHEHIRIFKPGVSQHKLAAGALKALMSTPILHNASHMQSVIRCRRILSWLLHLYFSLSVYIMFGVSVVLMLWNSLSHHTGSLAIILSLEGRVVSYRSTLRSDAGRAERQRHTEGK